jgi:protein ImuB
MKIVELDERASEHGLFVGQNLSDARAIVTDLEAREIDREITERVFADFADWHSNASPIVSIVDDISPWGDLALDITGVSHLFGGEAQMLEKLISRLAVLGYSVNGAVASTLGCAWALARFLPNRIVAEGSEKAALRALPVAALRLESEQVESLKQFGLKQIGQLYQRDRHDLQARFGTSLLLRLDQALGWLEEKRAPRQPLAEYVVERRFPEPIGLIEDVLLTAHDLAVSLNVRLEAAGTGAQTFHLLLYRVDHKVMTLSVNSARATRDPTHIGRLFSYRAERLEGEYDAGFGIDMIRLAVSSVSGLDAVQLGAFSHEGVAEDLDQLNDRMSSRLGTMAVLKTQLVASHIPEQAARLVPALAADRDQRRDGAWPRPARPLRLLPVPEMVAINAEVPDGLPASMIWRRESYKIEKASGPERLGAEWWRSGQRLQLVPPEPPKKGEPPPYIPDLTRFDPDAGTRDYYVVEDESGRRFWIFRQGFYTAENPPHWYLHGLFP